MDYSDGENGRKNSDVLSQVSDKLPPRKKLLNMDDAIFKTKFGLFNYAIIFVSAITLNAVAVETCAVSYVIPVACDMKMTSGQKGILAGAAFFGVICSSYLWGYLADTKGRRRIIQPTLFLASFSSIICSFIQNIYIFAAFRFLNGFFISGSAANIFAYLGEFHTNDKRTTSIISTTVIYNGMCTIVPVTAWAVINQDWQFQVPIIGLIYKPWRLFMVVCGLPGFISAIALIFLPESPKFVLSQGKKAAVFQILQKMNRWNNGKKSEFEEFEILDDVHSIENKQCISESIKKTRVPLLKSVWNQTVPLFKPPYLRSTILLCTIQFSLYSVFNGFFMFFAQIINGMSINLNSFIDDRMPMCEAIKVNTDNMIEIEYNETNSEVCIDKLDVSVMENGIIFELTFTIGLAIAGLLLGKVGKYPVILFILLSTGLSGIACILVNIPLLQVMLFVWLLCSGIVSNVLSSATVDLYPTTLRATAISFSLMFGRLGGVTGANTVAFLLDDNCEATFYLSGSMLIAISVLAFFIPNIHKRITDSDQDKTKRDPRLSIISFRGSVKSF
ncbi:synaptic vesicle glycoprotein 2B-like [Sitodiplosis mosellana]|uniref:synaptic vesicle glycoprotein 2B-like n=1 Tax=Sitodiplosis mosellana TaxID=263140 RepID=UPI002444EAFD|nr:synaptic vesicle glycoprotein 2B-like [Sitodiplosis mosellana]